MAKRIHLDLWAKHAKTEMIWKDYSTQDVADATGYTRVHVSSVLNGRIVSDVARKKISDFLGIRDQYDDETENG